jgi:hypothetical protein
MNIGVAGRGQAKAKFDVEIERRLNDSISQTVALLKMEPVA